MNLMCTIFYLRSIYISCRKYNCQNHIRVELFSTCLLLTEKMVQNSKPSLFQFHAIITSASLICFDPSFSIKISSYQVNLDLNITFQNAAQITETCNAMFSHENDVVFVTQCPLHP